VGERSGGRGRDGEGQAGAGTAWHLHPTALRRGRLCSRVEDDAADRVGEPDHLRSGEGRWSAAEQAAEGADGGGEGVGEW